MSLQLWVRDKHKGKTYCRGIWRKKKILLLRSGLRCWSILIHSNNCQKPGSFSKKFMFHGLSAPALYWPCSALLHVSVPAHCCFYPVVIRKDGGAGSWVVEEGERGVGGEAISALKSPVLTCIFQGDRVIQTCWLTTEPPCFWFFFPARQDRLFLQ